MATGEKFDAAKLFDFSAVGWYKVLGLSLKIAVAGLIIYGALSLWQAFFPKPAKNENKPTINVAEGGTSQYTVNQYSTPPRRLEYFLGLYGDRADSGDNRVGGFAGVKW